MNADTARERLDKLFPGDTEMARRMQSLDWTQTPLGPPCNWPRSLLMAVRIMLASRQPVWIGWGKDLIFLYNDPYKAIVGGKHGWALGRPTREVWSEIWQHISPLLDTALGGEHGTYSEAQLLIMERHGYREETYYTFSYSPVPSDDGSIGGIFCANTEDTQRVVSERQLALLQQMAASTASAQTMDEACRSSAEAIATDLKDMPFALVYLDDGNGTLRLAGSAGIETGPTSAPSTLMLDDDSPWHQRSVMSLRQSRLARDLPAAFAGEVPRGAWSQPPQQALVLPITASGHDRPRGLLVAGLNPFRKLNSSFRRFLDLVVGQLSASLASADAYAAERKRAEGLAEIDRVKTAFFSNLSHEFRTPLTLMLGPLAELRQQLALNEGPPSEEQLAEIDIAHRNGMRLLKLVNALLDFSRIEAGRMEASFEPVELGGLTAELASTFRSAIEKAGLRFVVDCPTTGDEAFVDRGMWEMIVLNLLSNAFKFTLEGEIVVRLRKSTELELTVTDTGAGIPEAELPRLFERFHRVAGARGRTHEGSGIGLALVHELVRLHGGTITVESSLGRGTSFKVAIPAGSHHLPREQVRSSGAQNPGTRARAFVEEAMHWLPADKRSGEIDGAPAQAPDSLRRHRILVVDDNADMRAYIARLLGERYAVDSASDGEEALSAIKARAPDVVVSDIMMPRLDGFGLLERLRADADTAAIPVILLSARAGEEARIEGLKSGADDYLVKPFTARNLVGRVEAQIARAEARSAMERQRKQLFELFSSAPIPICVLQGPNLVFEMANSLYLDVFGGRQIIGRPLLDLLPDAERQGYSQMLRDVMATGEPRAGEEALLRLDRHGNGELEDTYWTYTYAPLRAADGRIERVAAFCNDVTRQVLARRKVETLMAEARASEARFRNMADHAPMMIWVTGPDGSCTYLSKSWYGFTGQTEASALGSGWLGALHVDDRAAAEAQIGAATADRRPFRSEYRLRRADGEHRWALDVATPRVDETGAFQGHIGSVIDITELKASEETQRLLIGELNHRVKNTLATVQAIAKQTLRHAAGPEQFVTSFGGRVQALSRVHTMLTESTWTGADLAALIRDQVMLGAADDHRLTASGPSLTLEPQMTLHLALVLHELSTNSRKHGALSVPTGSVVARWSVEDRRLSLRWQESGGPPVSVPKRRGFGTILIEQSVKSHQGEAHMSVESTGVAWTISLPLPESPVALSHMGAASAGDAGPLRSVEEQRLPFAGKRLLVVEDEPLVALDLIATLESQGMTAIGPAGTPQTALELLESGGQIDAALLDANLNGRPVDDIAAALIRRGTPFAFVSGYDRQSLPVAFREAPLIGKPWTPTALLDTVDTLINRDRSSSRLGLSRPSR